MEHFKPEAIIRAKAGQLPPEEKNTVLEHLYECDHCLAALLKYCEDHYRAAKEYIAFGYLEDITAGSGAATRPPEELKQRLEEMEPPLDEKIAELAESLKEPALDDPDGQKVLLSAAQEASREDPDWTKVWHKFLSGIGVLNRIAEQWASASRALPEKTEKLLSGSCWSWRRVVACIPAVLGSSLLRQGVDYFKNVRHTAILARIVAKRIRNEAAEDTQMVVPTYIEETARRSGCCTATSSVPLPNGRSAWMPGDSTKEAWRGASGS